MSGTDFMDAGITLVIFLVLIWVAMMVAIVALWAWTTLVEFVDNLRRSREDHEVADLDAIWDVEWTEPIR